MIGLVIAFLILALISGFLGFSGITIISIGIARILFFVFLILLALSVVMHLLGGKRPPRNV